MLHCPQPEGDRIPGPGIAGHATTQPPPTPTSRFDNTKQPLGSRAGEQGERPWSVVKAGAEVGLLLGVLVVAVGALDPRPAIAAAVYLVPGLPYAAESIADGAPSTLAVGYWMVLAVLTATLAAAAWRISRQQRTQH
jgi:hypothetical protein